MEQIFLLPGENEMRYYILLITWVRNKNIWLKLIRSIPFSRQSITRKVQESEKYYPQAIIFTKTVILYGRLLNRIKFWYLSPIRVIKIKLYLLLFRTQVYNEKCSAIGALFKLLMFLFARTASFFTRTASFSPERRRFRQNGLVLYQNGVVFAKMCLLPEVR